MSSNVLLLSKRNNIILIHIKGKTVHTTYSGKKPVSYSTVLKCKDEVNVYIRTLITHKIRDEHFKLIYSNPEYKIKSDQISQKHDISVKPHVNDDNIDDVKNVRFADDFDSDAFIRYKNTKTSKPTWIHLNEENFWKKMTELEEKGDSKSLVRRMFALENRRRNKQHTQQQKK